MTNNEIFFILIPAGILLCAGIVYFLIVSGKRSRLQQRIARVTRRKTGMAQKVGDALTLRRKTKDSALPFVNDLLQNITTLSSLKARLERAGLTLPADIYVTLCVGATIVIILIVVLLHKPVVVGIIAGIVLGFGIPHFVLGHLGNRRVKKFLMLFPDGIDFIVRGLRSGLPVTESMNAIGGEMEEPIAGIFSSIGESVKLGVPVDKALQDTAKKLGSTEFNFFMTSIILQRETGGNLSEILANLADVLRKRFMMRMKIKAMSSEAKASAIIVGSLPFVVIIALTFISPGYLDPLIDDTRGNLALAGAATSLTLGIGIMIKMSRFEI